MHLPERVYSNDGRKQEIVVEKLKDVVFQAAFYDFKPFEDDGIILMP
jgi:hypothetical protein